MIGYFFSALLGVVIMFGPAAAFVWWRDRGRHESCPRSEHYGVNEYDAHPHYCSFPRGHTEPHDFSVCPYNRKESVHDSE